MDKEYRPIDRMGDEIIIEYLNWEQAKGASANALRRCKRFTMSLYQWLPDDKQITKERLLSWRQSLKENGYSSATELNYVKGINRYLDYAGLSHVRFNQGKAKDIAGQTFGYLTAIAPTGEKNRRDNVWQCRCRCGNMVDCIPSRLLSGNTLSCGCLRNENLKDANMFYAGTSLRQAMDDRVRSVNAESGYMGVAKKREKWKAYICYKGRRYSLGLYSRLEDAVKARANGKEAVKEDAQLLYEEYRKQQKLAYMRKSRAFACESDNGYSYPKIRKNNTSGFPGVYRRGSRWLVKIGCKNDRYYLGSFEDKESAISVREEAERLRLEDPQQLHGKYAR